MLSDVAGEMVGVAARRASAYSQITTGVFDQSTIPLGKASFDSVTNRHELMFVDDPVAVVAEAVRVLRPSRRFAAMTWIGVSATRGWDWY